MPIIYAVVCFHSAQNPHYRYPNHQLLIFIVQFSVRENLMVVTGNPETKELKDLLPDILKQVGPQQYNFLKTVLGDIGGVKEASAK
jgi:hypothetical protein